MASGQPKPDTTGKILHGMSALSQTMRMRMRYYWRAAVKLFGFCQDCWSRTNRSQHGSAHCQGCGRFV